MITYEQACTLIREVKPNWGNERLPLADCVGRTLAEDIVALVPSPPFTNSAMDGFAVRRDEVLAARGTAMPVRGAIMAGPSKPGASAGEPGSVVRIMTGAPVPEWADAVIPVEDAELDADGRVRFRTAPLAGANIRDVGDDIAAGSLLLKRGTVLEPERIMVAAAFGHGELLVTVRPELQLLSTGDELTEPGEELRHGTIYNSSKYFLIASAKALGFTDVQHSTIPDDKAQVKELIASLAQRGRPLVLITTGAVSAGEADFLPQIGAELGFRALFHKVAIRPGKPVYLAMRDNVVWLGLPGNPISTCVGWHFFARLLLSAAAGLPEPTRKTLVLKNEVRKPEDLRCFFRAEVTGDKAWVAQRQGSAQFAASTTNEAYVELPEGFSRIPAETRVEAIIV